MGLRRDREYCYLESKPCTAWVLFYFKDCLCNLRDDVSFGFGLVSVSLWAFAEVPQIVTNLKAKSSRGVSLLLLMTWILGDVFNVAGCILEPSTLPTQLHTALLYTVGSSILICQCIYYDHIVPWLKRKGKNVVAGEEEDSLDKQLSIPEYVDSGNEIACPAPMGPAFYTSARPLASSPSAYETSFPKSLEEKRKPTTPSKMTSFANQSRGVVNAVAGYGTLVAAAAAANLPNHAAASSRALLQKNFTMEDRSDPYGQLLGWGMAFIFISGRIPQIWLNIKRGNVEGLSPSMFALALVANATYVLSILVRSCKWVDIKANLPWLLDSIICFLLDFCILLQFLYYRYKRRKQYSILAKSLSSPLLA